MDTAILIQDLNHSYDLALNENATAEALQTLLAEKVNDLIRTDFERLVQLLYRIDVNEVKLRRLLAENDGEDAGTLIARLIIERQWQKIESRRRYRRDPNTDADAGDSEAEKW